MSRTPAQQNLTAFFESHALAFAQIYSTATLRTIEEYICENVVPSFLDLSRSGTAEPTPDAAFLTIYQYFMQAIDRWRLDYLNALSHSQRTGRPVQANIPMTMLDGFRQRFANEINARAAATAEAAGSPNLNLRGRAGARYRREAFHYVRNQHQETGPSSAIVDALQPLSGHGHRQFADVAFHAIWIRPREANRVHADVSGLAYHWDVAVAAREDVSAIPGLSVGQSTEQNALSSFRNATRRPSPVYLLTNGPNGNTNANAAAGPSGATRPSEARNSRSSASTATGPSRNSRTARATDTPYARPSSGVRLALQRPTNGDAAENDADKKKSSGDGSR
ncbi:hypothetical protein CYLTODRAFT_154869 [Cylindrobasidium torrendii FP15055 ss-10]|uniref:Uncharacterized protein n=1 Tax=Cylindrobasidium torrendii FP15055 ss-10 TaxID=1314674 RepID=A0A0D7BUM0_9AGAR|nr:hypothetical protein CYLTODRAFT_154869 [Cylindrobasidium torrendii FP15055 ss-10]